MDPALSCLNPNCGQLVKHRTHHQLCPRCYQDAVYLIKNGDVTWEILIAAGRAAPLEKREDPHETDAMRWMKEGLDPPEPAPQPIVPEPETVDVERAQVDVIPAPPPPPEPESPRKKIEPSVDGIGARGDRDDEDDSVHLPGRF